MFLTDHHISIFETCISSIWAGSCSPDHTTDIIRLSGARVTEDKLAIDLFVPEHFTSIFFANVKTNRKICFLCSSTHTFESYQVKGKYLEYRICNTEDQQYQKDYMSGFARNLVSLGIQAGMYFYDYYREPSLAIRMYAEEIYEQTPKAGTGYKIG